MNEIEKVLGKSTSQQFLIRHFQEIKSETNVAFHNEEATSAKCCRPIACTTEDLQRHWRPPPCQACNAGNRPDRIPPIAARLISQLL